MHATVQLFHDVDARCRKPTSGEWVGRRCTGPYLLHSLGPHPASQLRRFRSHFVISPAIQPHHAPPKADSSFSASSGWQTAASQVFICSWCSSKRWQNTGREHHHYNHCKKRSANSTQRQQWRQLGPSIVVVVLTLANARQLGFVVHLFAWIH